MDLNFTMLTNITSHHCFVKSCTTSIHVDDNNTLNRFMGIYYFNHFCLIFNLVFSIFYLKTVLMNYYQTQLLK